MKISAFLTGLAFMSVNAAPSGSGASASTSTFTPPPSATCGIEGKKKRLSQFLPFSTIHDVVNVEACGEVCYDRHHDARCQSIQYEPSTQSCSMWTSPVNGTMDVLDGTGDFYWDKACFPDPGPAPTATPAPLPCLPKNAVCGVKGNTLSDDGYFSIYSYVDGPEICYDICRDEHHAPRCVSYYYAETSRPHCMFYDVPMAGKVAAGSVNRWYWDVACLGNSGPCE